LLFLFSDQELTVTEDTNQSSTEDPNSSDLFSNMDFVHSQTDKNQKENESANFLRDKEIDNEILLFSSLLADKKTIESKTSTEDFWLKNKSQMPKLYELQLILLSIPASSSFIERFFSISGIVCDIKRAAMTDDCVIMRSLMKANMNILKQLNQVNN